MIQDRIKDISRLHEFSDLGYHYDTVESTPDQPVFICEEFGGIEMSVRLTL
jgi:hypothetical protein